MRGSNQPSKKGLCPFLRVCCAICRKVSVLQHVKRKATKMMKAFQILSYGDKMNTGDFHLEKKRLREAETAQQSGSNTDS